MFIISEILQENQGKHGKVESLNVYSTSLILESSTCKSNQKPTHLADFRVPPISDGAIDAILLQERRYVT